MLYYLGLERIMMKLFHVIFLLIVLSACAVAPTPSFNPQPITLIPAQAITALPSATSTPEPTFTLTPTPSPTVGNSDQLPIPLATIEFAQITVCQNFAPKYLVTCLSPAAYQTFVLGVQSGNNPQVFIVIGDSNSVPAVFMGHYEKCCFGEFSETADWYSGSFAYAHPLRQNGLSIKDVIDELLTAEIRNFNPAIAFVALGSNWGGGVDDWAERYEYIVQALLEDHLVLPVLWTVTDTPHLNPTIRSLAEKYSLPLVEWAAIGKPYLSTDGVHFIVPGWTFRSRVGLEVLDQLRTQIELYDEIIVNLSTLE